MKVASIDPPAGVVVTVPDDGTRLSVALPPSRPTDAVPWAPEPKVHVPGLRSISPWSETLDGGADPVQWTTSTWFAPAAEHGTVNIPLVSLPETGLPPIDPLTSKVMASRLLASALGAKLGEAVGFVLDDGPADGLDDGAGMEPMTAGGKVEVGEFVVPTQELRSAIAATAAAVCRGRASPAWSCHRLTGGPSHVARPPAVAGGGSVGAVRRNGKVAARKRAAFGSWLRTNLGTSSMAHRGPMSLKTDPALSGRW